jgi:DNA-directed RNA polymerase subunit RPC12/RpoP
MRRDNFYGVWPITAQLLGTLFQKGEVKRMSETEVVGYRCTGCKAESVLSADVPFQCRYCQLTEGVKQYRHIFKEPEPETMQWEDNNTWLNEFFRTHALAELKVEMVPNSGCSKGWVRKVWRDTKGEIRDMNTQVHGCYDPQPPGTPVLTFTAPNGESAALCVTHFLYHRDDAEAVARVLSATGQTEISANMKALYLKLRAEGEEKH